LNAELDSLLTFETPEKDPSKEVTKEDDSTRGSRRVCVSFYIDVSKANHSRALGDEMVSIYVSPKRKKFLAHKKLICEASDSLDHSFDQYSTLISKVYTETSFDSPLRKFCSRLMAFDLWVETIAAVPLIGDTGLQKAWIVCKDNVDLFKDFSSLIMTSSVEEESLDPCYSGGDDRCDFYKHRDGESCT